MENKLVKATVRVLEGARAGSIDVLFNPTEYGVEYSTNYQEKRPPGLSNPVAQFVNSNAEVLTMDLLFDTYTDRGGSDVTEKTTKFTEMMAVDASLHRPPKVQFEWGSFAFLGIVERISQRLTMFKGDGTPVRATLSVTFKKYRTVTSQLERPRRNSSDKTKRRVMESHDSIWLMAAREYGEPKYWRLIASTNNVDDPRRIEAGTMLTLPPLDDFRDVEPTDGD